jgi:hypothetical protein
MHCFRTAAILSALLAALPAAPGSAQDGCEYDGERMICPVGPIDRGNDEASLPFGLQPGWLSNLFRSHPPKPNVELERNLATYSSAFGTLYDNSRNLEAFAGLPAPRSQRELSRRVDDLLAAVWPEYQDKVLEYGLLRRQRDFFDDFNPRDRDTVAGMRVQLGRQTEIVATLTSQVAAVEAQAAATSAFEARLSRLALELLNDRSDEQRAIALVLLFAPDPRIEPARLEDVVTVTDVPGRISAPPPLPQFASAAPAAAAFPPPTERGVLTIERPSADTPLQAKLATLQVVGHDMQTLWFELPDLRQTVAAQWDEYRANGAAKTELGGQLGALYESKSDLDRRYQAGMASVNATGQNLRIEGEAIAREVIADLALEQASEVMWEQVESVAGVEGLQARIPADSTEALVDAARHGGRLLLPFESHRRQWDAFVAAQEQTLGILDRAQGYMTEAVRLAATGSPAEIQAHLEQVFASVDRQVVEFSRISASAVAEEEDAGAIDDAFVWVLRLKDANGPPAGN